MLDTGSRPLINSLESASPKPSKIFGATMIYSERSCVHIYMSIFVYLFNDYVFEYQFNFKCCWVMTFAFAYFNCFSANKYTGLPFSEVIWLRICILALFNIFDCVKNDAFGSSHLCSIFPGPVRHHQRYRHNQFWWRLRWRWHHGTHCTMYLSESDFINKWCQKFRQAINSNPKLWKLSIFKKWLCTWSAYTAWQLLHSR